MRNVSHAFSKFATSRALIAMVVQGLHSVVTLAVTVWFLRVAPPEEFAKVSAFFLVATILAAGAMQWITTLWLRGECSTTLVIYVSTLSAMITIIISWSYLWTVGLSGGLFETIILVPISLWSLFLYYGLRRQYLLNDRYSQVLWMDTARTLISVALILTLGADDLRFAGYLIWMIVAHLAPSILLIIRSKSGPFDFPCWSKISVARNSSVLSKGERGIVFAWMGNALFGQASILLAPLVVGVSAFAAVRAYEIFFVFVIFAAQVLDPIYLSRAQQRREINLRLEIFRTWATPVLILAAPIAILSCFELIMPVSITPSKLVIPIAYHYAKDLFWGVMLVSLCVAVQAPMRWFISVRGKGHKLLWATLIVSILSLLLMVMLKDLIADYWIPIASKIFFEMAMVAVLLWITYRQWRIPINVSSVRPDGFAAKKI